MTAHRLAEVTIVADAGMISDGNMKAIEAAGLSFILGARIPDLPYVVTEWRREHPDDEQPPDGLILTQPRPAGPGDKRRGQVVYYRCAGSTSRSPRPGARSPGRCRSSATGSSPWSTPRRRSTAPWKPGPAR
jgi:hypothetical protein